MTSIAQKEAKWFLNEVKKEDNIAKETRFLSISPYLNLDFAHTRKILKVDFEIVNILDLLFYFTKKEQDENNGNFSEYVRLKINNSFINEKGVEYYSDENMAYQKFSVKLKKIEEELLAKERREINEKRYKFVREFFKQLKDIYWVEIDG